MYRQHTLSLCVCVLIKLFRSCFPTGKARVVVVKGFVRLHQIPKLHLLWLQYCNKNRGLESACCIKVTFSYDLICTWALEQTNTDGTCMHIARHWFFTCFTKRKRGEGNTPGTPTVLGFAVSTDFVWVFHILIRWMFIFLHTRLASISIIRSWSLARSV